MADKSRKFRGFEFMQSGYLNFNALAIINTLFIRKFAILRSRIQLARDRGKKLQMTEAPVIQSEETLINP